MRTITTTFANGTSTIVSIADNATSAAQTAAIQSALNAAAAAGGGTVALSTGTWTVSGTGKASDGCLKIGSNTTLEGAGAGATQLKLADGSGAVTGIVRTDSGKTLADGSVKTVENVTIKGLTIDGNKAATTGDVDGFYCGPKPGTAQPDKTITLDGVEIANCSRYGIDPHEQTVGLTFRNCTAHHNGLDGFTIDFCSQVLIENCRSYENGRHGFNIVTGSHDVVVRNSVGEDNGGSGLTVQTGDNEIRAWTEGITIVGGRFEDNGRGGIEIKQALGVTVTGAVISRNGMDGVLVYGAEDVTFDGNTFTGNGGSGTVRLQGYLQDFNDADPLNDRWISTKNVWIDGVKQGTTTVPDGMTLWSYSLTDGDDQVTTSAGADVVAAGRGNDRVWAGAGDDVVYGNDGDDTLDGGTGNDRLLGGWGNDRLVWAGGIDTLDGGAGNDTADFSKATAAVVVDLTVTAMEASMGGGGIADLISIENLRGSSFNDTLIGNGTANVLEGLGGNDTILGGAGHDTVNGNAGNDRLVGGSGNDQLIGGTGSDVFVFAPGAGFDTIADFTRKQDKIEFTGVAGFSALTITQTGADTIIACGADQIVLQNVAAGTLTASDFLFL